MSGNGVEVIRAYMDPECKRPMPKTLGPFNMYFPGEFKIPIYIKNICEHTINSFKIEIEKLKPETPKLSIEVAEKPTDLAPKQVGKLVIRLYWPLDDFFNLPPEMPIEFKVKITPETMTFVYA